MLQKGQGAAWTPRHFGQRWAEIPSKTGLSLFPAKALSNVEGGGREGRRLHKTGAEKRLVAGEGAAAGAGGARGHGQTGNKPHGELTTWSKPPGWRKGEPERHGGLSNVSITALGQEPQTPAPFPCVAQLPEAAWGLKLLGAWQLIRDRSEGRGLGGVGLPWLVGMVVLVARWLSSLWGGGAGTYQAWHGAARFWEAAAHHGASCKTCWHLLAGPHAPAWCVIPSHPPSSCLQPPTPARWGAMVCPGIWMRNPLAPFLLLPQLLKQLLWVGSRQLARHGELASAVSLQHLIPTP